MTLLNSRGEYLLGAELPLATKRGTRIPNERRREHAPIRLQAAKDIVLRSHPVAQMRSLSATYNCMGMVFANRRTWIDTDHLQLILQEDNYRQTTIDDIQPGDVIVYRDELGSVTHVGLVSCIEVNLADLSEDMHKVTVLSQWGADGEYFHPADEVNERLGNPTEYWTDRQ